MDPRIRASRAQEKRVAKDMAGRIQTGSGNTWFAKNDVRNEHWSFECKTTTKQSYRLTNTELVQAQNQAILDGREMAFVTEINGRMWVTISYESFCALMKEE